MPGPTNPTEEYFDKGLWGWASTTWAKINALSNLLGVALHGYDGSAWQKLALVWGYTGHLLDLKTVASATAGANNLDFGPVTAGEVWRLEGVSGRDQTNAPSGTLFQVITGSDTATFFVDYSPAAGQHATWTGTITVPAGGYVRVKLQVCTLNDTLDASIVGYKMAVS